MENFDILTQKIAKNIKYFRKKKKLFQYELADKIPTSQSNISAYEKGKKCNLNMLIQIADALDVSLEKLMFFEEKTQKELVTFPISKFTDSIYYCYYVVENVVQSFQLKVNDVIDKYNAEIEISFNDDSNPKYGTLTLDNKFAIVNVHDFEKNKNYFISFNYHHDSEQKLYFGGIALLQLVNHIHNSPCVQLCAISKEKITFEKYEYLKSEFLDIKDTVVNTSKPVVILEIDTSVDEKYFKWLTQINNIEINH